MSTQQNGKNLKLFPDLSSVVQSIQNSPRNRDRAKSTRARKLNREP